MPMIDVITWYANCDHDGCNQKLECSSDTKYYAEREIKEEGWTVVGNKCYCPEHALEGKE